MPPPPSPPAVCAPLALPINMSLAKSIRAQERDAYDLAGYGATQIAEVCTAAFSTPVDAPAPFRVTFIVGGGKKVRTGYGGPEGLVRETCAALEALSFTEDRSASLGQQGVFKYQHDTDKVRVTTWQRVFRVPRRG